jgi:hypothetical protein
MEADEKTVFVFDLIKEQAMKISPFSKRRSLAVIGILTLLLNLLPGSAFAAAPASAQGVVPVPGGPLTVNVVTVNDDPGGQTDPHVSGDWVSYTDNSASGIRFQNLDMGTASDRLIPPPDGFFDSLSDINGATIVFMRASGVAQRIYLSQIDPFGNPGPAIEVFPASGIVRRRSALGGDTIAFEDFSYDPLGKSEITLSSILDPAGPAYRLTDDTLVDQFPAVSPDGNVVVWLKCEGAHVCDVWRAERTMGIWDAPEQVTATADNESLPDTNGPVTVYDSGRDGFGWNGNIRWSVKDSSNAYVESELDLPGEQRNPNIAGNFIVYEGNAGGSTQFDLYLYNLATNRLYQLTDTSVSETFSDVTIEPGGLVRVAWAQPKTVYPYDMDVYAMSFIVDTTPPVITPDIQGTLGAYGWYTSDVTLSWAVSDAQSPFTSIGCDPVTITSDQAATQYTCSADSDGGASSASVTIARDASKPATTVIGLEAGATHNLGSVPQASCATTDNLSGVATEAALALTGGDAQGVGAITATCSGALDAAGNAADPAVVHFTVLNPFPGTYNFTGFFQPVDNPGEGPSYVFNSVKAGSAIPVKFSLGGNQGLDIFADGFPKSQPVSCTTAALSDPIEQTVMAGNSSLSYDAASDNYTYVWKTNKGWAGTCRVLSVQLDDGTQYLAYFQFK